MIAIWQIFHQNAMLSNPYAKQDSLDYNPLNRLLYSAAYPLAIGFARLRVTPNQVTGLSCFMSAIAGYAMIQGSPWMFVCAWTLALLLDYCDGTVARMTGSVSQTAFRFDHTSDLIKVSGILICVALGYESTVMWIVASGAAIAFLVYNSLNLELKVARERHSKSTASEGNKVTLSTLAGWWRISRTTLLAVNGHTLLFFLFTAIDVHWALLVCTHFAVICLLGAAQRIALLRQLPRG
ncbi:MAG: CDP-alcohol phosphatidyltransferase family protein [Hydrogenophaga sp.]|uniref:CDP-alcohol phosphatidyltransferase family protein n=1 Tax=Hydrogenophaga sp. TaxID=1904254 RepID=UPI002628A59E|nr:CDP-alcohol phosphatidyltransferase family protein [Hydrogenophaga sp.]MCV0437837.1 CDP-alcohol phosphatidyltransferase family protein [Hydrogenophaga sp.]